VGGGRRRDHDGVDCVVAERLGRIDRDGNAWVPRPNLFEAPFVAIDDPQQSGFSATSWSRLFISMRSGASVSQLFAVRCAPRGAVTVRAP
jgi:hypothetical protein